VRGKSRRRRIDAVGLERDARWAYFTAPTVVSRQSPLCFIKMIIQSTLKYLLTRILTFFMRGGAPILLGLQRVYTHAQLSAALATPLPTSTVVLGRVSACGTRQVDFGEDVLLYPGVHLETQGAARIKVGGGVVMSSGVHIVAMAGVVIDSGTLIGEYTSIRDANHSRDQNRTIRDSGHISRPIKIGREVWIGRGVTILGGVTIGDRATIGANAVVTKDVSAGTTVVGIPAAPIDQSDFPNARADKRARAC
jgi:acetyltransferase-like isoleucine patch superfamily enzyme